MDLSPLLNPGSIAIVGATSDPKRLGGGTVLRFLNKHGYKGRVLPVNPNYDDLLGHRCYRSLADIEMQVDVAVFAVPAKQVVESIRAVPVGHVRVALVLTSGFGELDAEGAQLERELLDAARDRGMTVVGPNSVGVANLANGVVPTISQYFDRAQIPYGPLALVSQSGAFGTALLAQAEIEGISFGYFVSSGNEIDVEFSDFGYYLLDQENVRVLCGYIESIRNGERFAQLARRAAQTGKPILILKVGSTEAGAAAARSHTGALVGSDAIAQSFFDSLNILRATDGENLLDLLRILERTPESRGKRLAILSHSGGAGVMAADAAALAGAEVPPLPDDLRHKLAGMLPKFASLNNPLDMTGGASLNGKLMADCLREVLGHNAFDAALLCVNLIWREGKILMQELGEVAATAKKPFAVSWVAPEDSIAPSLRKAAYAVFSDPARSARVLARRLVYDEGRRVLLANLSFLRPASLPTPGGFDTVSRQSEALAAYGIRTPRQVLATSAAEAVKFQADTKRAVALKIASPDISHRTEIGAVLVGVEGKMAVANAYETVVQNALRSYPEARIEGVLVQEMIAGFEVFLGLKRDPVFGPVVAVSGGGILVELMGDPQMHPAPLSRAQAERLIGKNRFSRLLSGYRGSGPLDRDALVEAVERLSWLGADNPQIKEIDLNPVVVLAQGLGCVALDFKIICT
ncbi:MAG: acetate--CoA ligase family protein [Xanthobacteraceae bacterium]